MSREVIAVDIDDVLSSQTDVLMRFSNERYGTHLTHDDFKKPGTYWGYYEQLLGLEEVEGSRRFEEFLAERWPLKQIITPESLEAVKRLGKKYDLDIVTSRGLDYQEETIEWLKQHAPEVFRSVHFVDLWHNESEKATKAKICQEIGAGYLIDDNAEHCNLAAEAGVKALLFGEWGWNNHQTLSPGVVRVLDWQAVLEYFDA